MQHVGPACRRWEPQLLAAHEGFDRRVGARMQQPRGAAALAPHGAAQRGEEAGRERGLRSTAHMRMRL